MNNLFSNVEQSQKSKTRVILNRVLPRDTGGNIVRNTARAYQVELHLRGFVFFSAWHFADDEKSMSQAKAIAKNFIGVDVEVKE